MSRLLNAISGLMGMDSQGGNDSGVDESKALQFTQDRWNDLKNSYVVWH